MEACREFSDVLVSPMNALLFSFNKTDKFKTYGLKKDKYVFIDKILLIKLPFKIIKNIGAALQ